MSKRNLRDQVLALAGIAQAAVMADQLARTGRTGSEAMAATLHSITALNSQPAESIFIDRQHLRDGLNLLRQIYERNRGPQSQLLRYCASLLHLERQLRKRSDLLDTIRERIGQAERQSRMFPDDARSNLVQQFAGLYLDTISTLRYRIRINGQPQILQQTSVAAQIRTVLLGGIRAVHLWRHLGGSRVDFILKRKAIYREILALLEP